MAETIEMPFEVCTLVDNWVYRSLRVGNIGLLNVICKEGPATMRPLAAITVATCFT